MDNEDSRSELAALEIGPADTVVAVAAGGGRALSLLAAEPARLVAVDRRVEQLHTLELKAAALGALEYEELLAFVGVADGADRLDQYAALRGALTPGARRYWDARRSLLEGGCLYAGRLEQAMRRASAALRPLGLLRWAEPFLAAEAIEAQRALLVARGRRVARGLRPWRLFFHPALVYAVAQDPGFLRSTEGSVGRYVVQRFEGWLSANLARESFLIHFLYHGRLHPSGPAAGPSRRRGRGAGAQAPRPSRAPLRRPRRRRAPRAGRRADQVVPLRRLVLDVRGRVPRAAPRHRAPRRAGLAPVRPPLRGAPPTAPGPSRRVQRLAALCAHLDTRDASIIYSFEVAEWPAERAGLARWDHLEGLEILDPEGEEVPRELDGSAPGR